jgi:hypothetical protein
MKHCDGDDIPTGYITIAELKDREKARTSGELLSEEARAFIEQLPTRDEHNAQMSEAAKQCREGIITEEEWKLAQTSGHRAGREAGVRDEIAVASVWSGLRRGEPPAVVRSADTGELVRILPDDWQLMQLTNWTISRGWMCANPGERCHKYNGRWVLVSVEDAERFLNRKDAKTGDARRANVPGKTVNDVDLRNVVLAEIAKHEVPPTETELEAVAAAHFKRPVPRLQWRKLRRELDPANKRKPGQNRRTIAARSRSS